MSINNLLTQYYKGATNFDSKSEHSFYIFLNIQVSEIVLILETIF